MTRSYDLHCHSTFSDGELSPEALLEMAATASVDVLALTDHDSIEGLPRAQAAAKSHGIELIPGVEVSTRWFNEDIHIVGLNINPNNADLVSALTQNAQIRAKRAQEIAMKLEHLGFEETYDCAKKLAGSDNLTRPHFAKVLIQKGIVRDFAQAFQLYLGQGKKAYVPCEWLSISVAVKAIQAAGGVAVLAHPMRYRLSRGKLIKLINHFKNAGGQGIEVIYQQPTEQERAILARLCQDHRLLASMGSDFHGPGIGHGRLGVVSPLPKACHPVWSEWEAS